MMLLIVETGQTSRESAAADLISGPQTSGLMVCKQAPGDRPDFRMRVWHATRRRAIHHVLGRRVMVCALSLDPPLLYCI